MIIVIQMQPMVGQLPSQMADDYGLPSPALHPALDEAHLWPSCRYLQLAKMNTDDQQQITYSGPS